MSTPCTRDGAGRCRGGACEAARLQRTQWMPFDSLGARLGRARRRPSKVEGKNMGKPSQRRGLSADLSAVALAEAEAVAEAGEALTRGRLRPTASNAHRSGG